MRPNQVVSILVAEFGSRIRPLRRKGEPLTSGDATSVQETYIQWMCLLNDIGFLPLDCDKRTVRHIIDDLLNRDVLDVLNAFAESLSLLLREKPGFKAQTKLISPHLWQFIRPHWEEHLQGDTLSTGKLIQCFSYPGRLSLKEIDLTEQSISDYVSVEDSITGEEATNIFIRPLSQIISRWVARFDLSNLVPGHGPGGVAGHGRVSLETKYRDLTTDVMLSYAFKNALVTSPVPSHLSRVSQTIFVAKNHKTFRTISMEPTSLMYYQQGIWKAIRDSVKRNAYLENRIGFSDQTRNQSLARIGSVTRRYATIDLSAASDSVTWQLVKALFGKTKLYRYLLTTRSTHTVLPDGQFLKLKKFAPMGSAMCFPIETIIFASICEYVTREHDVAGDFSVYGDDIIVPTQCAEDIVYVLGLLGFKTNDTKSFVSPDSPFRESCGGEYWNGQDVTPMRISREYTSTYSPERFTSLQALANEAYDRGYSTLRRFFIYKLQSTGVIPYFADSALKSQEPTNYHTDKRWNWELQRYEARVTSLVSRPMDVVQDEEIRYRHWLEINQSRTVVIDAFVSNVARSFVLAGPKWRETSSRELVYPILSRGEMIKLL